LTTDRLKITEGRGKATEKMKAGAWKGRGAERTEKNEGRGAERTEKTEGRGAERKKLMAGARKGVKKIEGRGTERT
jgi:hypothetical protein